MTAPSTTAASTAVPVLEVKKDLRLLQTGRPVAGYSNTPELLEKHHALTGGKPYFRFPPEPNGFLHIGHAKSMNLNFGCAVAHGGKCYLRYDDTNPETEEQVYIDAIQEMVRWMGWKPDWITFSSDYFQQLYEFAIQLIKAGKAYVDHSTADEIKKQRESREESPWRNRSIEENLLHFEYMRQGRYAEGEATLRVKIDMKSDNPNMRDFIAYRVKFSAHPHAKDKWCIYPSYDYTHCLVDSLEDIDYSLCTLEFETRRESYFWLLEQLNLWRPFVWEFSRLNVTGSLLSKRKINVLVKKGIVRGFDDPRLLTLAGMRRRGYTPEAINRFCDHVGITRSMNVIQSSMLEHILRDDLDERTERRLMIVDPVKVVIDNWDGEMEVMCLNHPRKPDLQSRKVMFTKTFYIDRSDFRTEDNNSKFYGLAPGPRPVGLKYSGNIICRGYECDEAGRPSLIHVEVDFGRTTKPKTNITWVSEKYAIPVEFRLYGDLLKDDRAAIDPEFLKYINSDSEQVQQGYAEPEIQNAKVFESVQAERFGYFVVDPDTRPGHLVMNRVLTLKEDKEKGAMAPCPQK
ncbi:putative glutaminyl-tRNA synthetase [Trypanosoma cruzi]|uniref:glutamine--tRNA ligase n=2 Tax=Trypanosoma cruzi TaxID=5693 RepID=Q4E0Y0_TRYCC|nr:glutaminyl-tRNA synthetase, putative [Trypanosoma cruzi]EAN98425.1 glutaminyl-tRNA synthetase, putative [Trypanosoma cruzi]KAF8280959.1 putative glutaminyl-tRNA synthetase [Trypanosoma cruzi]PWV00890.1 putative glutaminyl-tRNA synthetase [Trypanosoma cruzi]RNC57604.1 putative glutaminyl-tRNA synthetase [Trypanosoma cruzi]|eukprot:XP_820276.1 glutaminyl-tRNA synthetase [Trypanosoma cruzi strain CL Brener]